MRVATICSKRPSKPDMTFAQSHPMRCVWRLHSERDTFGAHVSTVSRPLPYTACRQDWALYKGFTEGPTKLTVRKSWHACDYCLMVRGPLGKALLKGPRRPVRKPKYRVTNVARTWLFDDSFLISYGPLKKDAVKKVKPFK